MNITKKMIADFEVFKNGLQYASFFNLEALEIEFRDAKILREITLDNHDPGDNWYSRAKREIIFSSDVLGAINAEKQSRFYYVRKPPSIPDKVAVCPICRAAIYITHIDDWHKKTGIVKDDGFGLNCITEPELKGSVTWTSWYIRHFATQPNGWKETKKKVLEWLNRKYRIHPEEQ